MIITSQIFKQKSIFKFATQGGRALEVCGREEVDSE